MPEPIMHIPKEAFVLIIAGVGLAIMVGLLTPPEGWL
jgi:hypothetical protein